MDNIMYIIISALCTYNCGMPRDHHIDVISVGLSTRLAVRTIDEVIVRSCTTMLHHA